MKYTVGESVEFKDINGNFSVGVITECHNDGHHYNIQRTDEHLNPSRYGNINYVPEHAIYPYIPPNQSNSTDDAWNRAMKGI